MITMPKDFKEFLSTLVSSEVDFLLVGGWALAFHGCPRATIDIDVWIDRSPANVARVERALVDFGFAPDAATALLLSRPDGIVRMGRPPMRIEILSSISGREFEDCFPRAAILRLDDFDVKVIGRDDLRENKIASGRLKDLADVALLDGKG